MARWVALIVAGAVSFVLCLMLVGAEFELGMLLLLAAFVLFAAGILYRPRELDGRARAQLATAGLEWGDGIGPVPGEFGPSIPIAGLPVALNRVYRGRSKDYLEQLRATDANLLAARGYVPTSSQYLEGRWRGIDWIAAIALLLLFFIVGIVAIIYLLATKPTGTLTVTYERRIAALPVDGPRPFVPQAAAGMTATSLVAQASGPAAQGQWRCAALNDRGERCGLVANHMGTHRTEAELQGTT
jgi:hypothetical protein